MDRYDIMMPRLFPAEAKPRLYKGLLVTAGIILTCYGLLTAGSILLPTLRERIIPPAISKKVVTSRLHDVPAGNSASSKFQSPCSSISPLAVP
jgi:hypothetical protein